MELQTRAISRLSGLSAQQRSPQVIAWGVPCGPPCRVARFSKWEHFYLATLCLLWIFQLLVYILNQHFQPLLRHQNISQHPGLVPSKHQLSWAELLPSLEPRAASHLPLEDLCLGARLPRVSWVCMDASLSFPGPWDIMSCRVRGAGHVPPAPGATHVGVLVLLGLR